MSGPTKGRTPLDGTSVGFIGVGNLGRALVQGLLGGGHPRTDIHVSTHRKEKGRVTARDLGVTAHPRNRAVVEASDIVLLAVKPQHVLAVCDEIRPTLGDRLLISCAAGLTTNTCRTMLDPEARVGRAMPSVSAAVGAGAAALWLPDSVAGDQRVDAAAIFEVMGVVVQLPKEGMFDVATALVGSGPAFTCVFAEAFADAAVADGLPRDLSLRLSAAMVRGVGTLLTETGEHPVTWKERVTSPGGTTAAGLMALERLGGRAAAIAAIQAATQRAQDLGEQARREAQRHNESDEGDTP